MTLDDAISILNAKRKDDVVRNARDSAEACQLGIEALKEVQRLRRVEKFDPTVMLPGETA
ncbi:hypothetical protein ES708_02603 [subsurface metagenome]